MGLKSKKDWPKSKDKDNIELDKVVVEEADKLEQETVDADPTIASEVAPRYLQMTRSVDNNVGPSDQVIPIWRGSLAVTKLEEERYDRSNKGAEDRDTIGSISTMRLFEDIILTAIEGFLKTRVGTWQSMVVKSADN